MGKRLAATALFLALSSTVAFAQMPPPADNAIKSVYADLDKYENQIQSNPRKSSAKRILRLLSITEGRLQGSSNTSDPSFQAAQQRLVALQDKLQAIIDGRPANAAPAQQAGSGQQQPATTSADPTVQAAANELARISAAVDQLDPGDKTNGQKYLNELKPVGESLRGVANKDAAWKQAALSYNALQKRILEIANSAAPAGGGQSGGQTAQQPAKPAAPATASNKPDPQTERAVRELKFVERNVGNQRGGDIRGAQRIVADLERIGKMLGEVQDRSHPSWQEAVDYRRQLYEQLAARRFGAISQGLDNVEKAINNAQDVEFLDPNLIQSMNNYLADYDRQLQVYAAFKDLPAAEGLFERPQEIAAVMDKRIQAAQSTEGELGDVEAEVAAIEQRMRQMPVPKQMQYETMTPETVTAWVEEMKAVQAQTAKDAAYIEKIQGRTNRISKNDMQRLNYWVTRDRPRKIQESLQYMTAWFEANWDHHQRNIEWHQDDDPNDPNHQANRFVGEGRYDENMERFQDMLDFLEMAEIYEAAFGIDTKAQRAEQRAAAEQAMAKYQDDYKTAVGAVRMSKGVDNDELRDIAREVLESGRYENVGEIVRVETTKMSRRKETRGSISGTVTGASISASDYEWDEFQAHTIEKHGDQYFIYHSTMKYFYSGGTKTPLDRWLVSGRFKGNPILEENIDK